MAAAVFVVTGGRCHLVVLPERWAIDKEPLGLGIDQTPRNTDVKHLDCAAQQAARQKQVTGLSGHEGHSRSGLQSGTTDKAGHAVNAGR